MSSSRPPLDLIGRIAERLGKQSEAPVVPNAPDASGASTLLATATPLASERALDARGNGHAGSGPSAGIELDLVQLQKEGYLTPQNQRSLIAEEYRIVKRPLLRSAFDRSKSGEQNSHVVMVTSAKPGEGKTFTAINLAMSVASERDLYVLLVDCDIRRMTLSRKLGVGDRKGIMDVLLNPKMAVSDVIVKTSIPNLALIPTGQPIEAATELFASQSMANLVDELASRYPDRFIIFDTPPVLASSEPSVLALHVGHVIMVVAAGETTKAAIAESLPLVNSCPNVHFILNRAKMVAGQDRFGYYGNY
ncbi:MAG: XrtA-associated tyrosine autokinase [Rhodobacteraceae bacterium]|nr:XrtA-associated tyrosine autokinase [Paracoccaceae bacterium]